MELLTNPKLRTSSLSYNHNSNLNKNLKLFSFPREGEDIGNYTGTQSRITTVKTQNFYRTWIGWFETFQPKL